MVVALFLVPARRRSPAQVAGAGGFEPPNVGSKGRCLTTWLRPNQNEMLFNFCSSETLCFSSLTIFGNNELFNLLTRFRV
jgi:hypothetical protein